VVRIHSPRPNKSSPKSLAFKMAEATGASAAFLTLRPKLWLSVYRLGAPLIDGELDRSVALFIWINTSIEETPTTVVKA